MRLLASAKSVAAVGTDAIFIIGQRPRHMIAFVQPFQQVTILASLTAKRLGFRHYRLST
jgi:actin-like ATPase involved in cell morphogenesis